MAALLDLAPQEPRLAKACQTRKRRAGRVAEDKAGMVMPVHADKAVRVKMVPSTDRVGAAGAVSMAVAVVAQPAGSGSGGGGSGYCGGASSCTTTQAGGALYLTNGSVTVTPQ
ncbi:hypothetical protein [Hyphomicrobium sp.]|uniref:hypothetical protein n=1 Tax=Hyphomicrobium sp. TaxID=82 RepID=UPI003561D025